MAYFQITMSEYLWTHQQVYLNCITTSDNIKVAEWLWWITYVQQDDVQSTKINGKKWLPGS